MSAQACTIPARARTLAVQLAALFTTDQEIVVALNDAHRRLAAANDRLWTDPVLDPPVIHEQIRRAFLAHQQASEQRRQLDGERSRPSRNGAGLGAHRAACRFAVVASASC